MNVAAKCGLLLLVVVIAGCGGGPTLDTTNEKTFEASRKAMTASMSDNQKRQFSQDLMAALGPEGNKGGMQSGTEKYKPLHGLSVEQIEAMAASKRQRKSP